MLDRLDSIRAPTAAVLISVCAGMMLAWSLAVGAMTIIVLVSVVALVIRGRRLWWDGLAAVLAGGLVLGYGFANLGLTGAIPVPLADVMLVCLLVGMLALRIPFGDGRAPFVFAGLFFTLATIRLAFDVRVWHIYAVRDYTLPLELGFICVGYGATRIYGHEKWVATLGWVFAACAVYSLFFPFRETLARLGPQVGLQHPTPLLGSYEGAGTAAAAALFFFLLVRPWARWSYILAAVLGGELVLVQSRGLYLAVPLAFAVLILLGSARMPRVRRGIVVGVIAGIAGTALVFTIAPQGRLGRVTPGFLVSQLRTLTGAQGPGAGSFATREAWIPLVMREVRQAPDGYLIGVGLGPDLTGGYGGNQSIRKPHDDYLEVFGRYGAVGLVLFVGFLLTAITQIARGARRARGEEAALLWWSLSTVLVYLVIAATQPLLAFPYGTIPTFLALGIGLALACSPHNGAGATDVAG